MANKTVKIVRVTKSLNNEGLLRVTFREFNPVAEEFVVAEGILTYRRMSGVLTQAEKEAGAKQELLPMTEGMKLFVKALLENAAVEYNKGDENTPADKITEENGIILDLNYTDDGAIFINAQSLEALTLDDLETL